MQNNLSDENNQFLEIPINKIRFLKTKNYSLLQVFYLQTINILISKSFIFAPSKLK